MRLAYLTQSYPPMVSGAALVTQRLAQGMAARGHEVLVLAASDRGRPYLERNGSLTAARLSALPNPVRVGQRFLLWPRASIRRALREFRPDILHLMDPIMMGYLGLQAAHALGVPAVFTLHQLPWFVASYLPRPMRATAEKRLWRYLAWWLRQCSVAIAPSRTIADLVRAHTGCELVPITNGVDLNRFTPEPATRDEREQLLAKYDLRPDLPVILYVGRIDADKQVGLAVQAAASTMRHVPAQLLVAGDGKERPAVERLAEHLGIQAVTRFPGYVSANGDLPGLYRLASVFITASEVEIQSSVVLEAAASGVPVVTVRASSMPEFVEDGVTGYLVPPRDVAALGQRLVELLANPDRARAMGQAALCLAQQHTPLRSLDSHEQLYCSLAAERA